MKLNNFLKIFSILTYAVILLFSNYSIAEGSTYIGIAGLYSHLRLPNSYGGNVFSRKMAPGFNLALGHMFNDNFGWEAGMEINDHDNNIVFIPGNEVVFGTVDIDDQSLVYNAYKSKLNQHNEYCGVTIKKPNIIDNFFISILLGASLFHIKAKSHLFLSHFFDYDLEETYEIASNNVSYFNKTHLNFITKIAIGYKYSDKFHIKIFYDYNNTSKINGYMASFHYAGPYKIEFKNSFKLGLRADCFL